MINKKVPIVLPIKTCARVVFLVNNYVLHTRISV